MSMFGIIKKLLFAKQLSFEKGEIKLLGQPVVMFPVVLFIEMFKELKRNNPKNYKDIIYEITDEVGRTYSDTLRKKYGLSGRKLIEWDMNTLSLAGLGNGEIIRLDLEKKTATIKVTNTVIGKGLRPSKEPVDTVIAGMIGGSGKIIFNSEKILCKEIKCIARGDKFCMFEIYEKI